MHDIKSFHVRNGMLILVGSNLGRKIQLLGIAHPVVGK